MPIDAWTVAERAGKGPSRRDRRHLPLRIASFAACLLIAALAVSQLWITGRNGTYLALAALIGKGEPVSAAVIAHHAGGLSVPLATCRSDIRAAAITVATRNVELQWTASVDAVAGLAALQSLERLLRDSLACTPSDGMLWARLAAARWFLGGTAEEQARLMAMAQAYAPAELSAIRFRLGHWRRLSPRVAALAGDVMRADIRTVLHHAPPRAARQMLGDATPLLRPAIAAEAVHLPVHRPPPQAPQALDGPQARPE